MDGRSDFGVTIPDDDRRTHNPGERQGNADVTAPDTPEGQTGAYSALAVHAACHALSAALDDAATGLGHSATGRALHRAATAAEHLSDAIVFAATQR